MQRAAPGHDTALARIRWAETFRIIPCRFPPIDLFERVADPADSQAISDIETLTDPRYRDEIGEIHLVPLEDRVTGPGASWVMAPFTHINRHGSRFSDGTYGVYYAAHAMDTAIAETVYHLSRFYAATSDPPHREDMRVLVGTIDAELHDVRGMPAVHDPDDYSPSRALGSALRKAGSNGIVHHSVRHQGGKCIAVFRPRLLSVPKQERHLQYDWDGTGIGRYFDYDRQAWTAVP